MPPGRYSPFHRYWRPLEPGPRRHAPPDSAEDQVRLLSAALRFYADPASWLRSGEAVRRDGLGTATLDFGDTARAALGRAGIER